MTTRESAASDRTALDPPGRRPLHRTVGRGIVAGAVVWSIAAAACAVFLLATYALGANEWARPADLLVSAVAVGLGSGIAAALVVLGCELAVRIERVTLRPVVLVCGGLVGAVLVSWLVAWVALVLELGPRVAAHHFVLGILGWWLEHPREALVILGFSAVLALGPGLPRILPFKQRADWPRAARLILAGASGLLAGLIAEAGDARYCLLPSEFWEVPGAFVVGPLALAVGLELGETADDALVLRWRRHRDAIGR